MKKILFLTVVALVLFAGCDKNEDPNSGKGKLDPNAMITLKPAASARAAAKGLTGLEVVEQALSIKWQTHYGAMGYTDEVKDIGRSFNEQQKDYETPALLMLGVDVITQEGKYERTFTNAFNVFITNNQGDTIAYIPDAVINAARPLIEAAYDDENYTEVYRLFNEAFTFLPI
jgi:hypothetical protein